MVIWSFLILILNSNPSWFRSWVFDDEEAISKKKNVFKNQRIHKLAREYLDKEFGDAPSSTFNAIGDYIFILILLKVMLS
jgi:hypothetical protein